MSRNRAILNSDPASIIVESELEQGLLSSFPVLMPAANMEYRKSTVPELRKELKSRNLSTAGRKQDLVLRLQQCDERMVLTRMRERRREEVSGKQANGATAHRPSRPARASMSETQKEALKKERESLVLWRKPVQTLYYFLLETLILCKELLFKLWTYRRSVFLVLLSTALLVAGYHLDGKHQKFVSAAEKQILWWAYWVGLGVLSSVGLGTGLHTFLLYLGPHIASVTLAAFECMSVDFPEPPYPDEITCPEVEGSSMSLLTIMSKLRVEAFMWGAGTALGELPPYFMARAARLSGQTDEEGAGTALGELPPYFMARAARLSGQTDEEEEELEELLHEQEQHHKLGLLARAKIGVHNMVKRVGFWGILLCASIPNPLFDLAGITCGHFLVPFWTFFGATLIGKAVIKMHIQKLFVIFMFSEKHVERVVSLIGYIPWVGPSLQLPFKEYLSKQKAKLHVAPGTAVPSKPSLLSQIFEKLVLAMVVFFVVSIVNSMAQQYHKRQTQPKASPKTSQD